MARTSGDAGSAARPAQIGTRAPRRQVAVTDAAARGAVVPSSEPTKEDSDEHGNRDDSPGRRPQAARAGSPASLAVCAGVLALCGLVAVAAAAAPAPQTAPGDPLDPRTYAPKSKLFLVAHATGVQKYTCQANGTWLFTDPEATLFKTNGNPKAFGTHFLNFATGRPVWQLKDGSSVEAARTAQAPGGTGNIAWLLLQAVATTGGDGRRPARAGRRGCSG